jgi:MFS superfamily sulfate permease-like transporter
MKIKTFEFSLRELSGAMGDFGTLFPLSVGYIVVCGMNPAGFLVMMGLANIVTGLVYRLPLPIEPMKVIAVIAIAQQWPPSMVYAAGVTMGLVWIVFSVTGVVDWIARHTPLSIVRGIQLSLAALLLMQALRMAATGWLLGALALGLIILLRDSRYAPSGLVVMALGVGISLVRGDLRGLAPPGLQLPPLTSFTLAEVWAAFLQAGLAQIPLTVSNAVIATAALIKLYWPEQPVSERKLALNQGIMNVVIPFFGGFPLCHGAGGLAGQYAFGARTGGANLLEGGIEVALGLFLSASIAQLFSVFPQAIIGAMLFYVGLQLLKGVRTLEVNYELTFVVITVLVSVPTNMAFGYLAGMVAYHAVRLWQGRRRDEQPLDPH